MTKGDLLLQINRARLLLVLSVLKVSTVTLFCAPVRNLILRILL